MGNGKNTHTDTLSLCLSAGGIRKLSILIGIQHRKLPIFFPPSSLLLYFLLLHLFLSLILYHFLFLLLFWLTFFSFSHCLAFGFLRGFYVRRYSVNLSSLTKRKKERRNVDWTFWGKKTARKNRRGLKKSVLLLINARNSTNSSFTNFSFPLFLFSILCFP